MKFSSKVLLILTLALSFTMLSGSYATAQEKMSMDEYNAQLKDWQTREANAKKAVEECASSVAALKTELAGVTAETEKIWGEILKMIGTDQASVDAYRNMLKALDSQADGLLALSPEELFKRSDEVAALEAKLAEAKKNKISVLTEMQNLIASIEGKITQIKNKMPKAMYDNYTVVVGDYLWKIAGKKDIYANPYQWMRIYSYNKDQIKDPDLIYPKQVFKIHRECGPDEYLVAKGDYLKKIASNPKVFGDPTKWTKLYEKNKAIIGGNPAHLYPYTVLVIPR